MMCGLAAVKEGGGVAWVSVHDNVIGGKLRELAKEMGCTQEEALGILVSLWIWSLNNADKDGKFILKKGKKQPVKGASDTEIIPLSEDSEAYMKKNVLPYNPLAYIDPAKDKIGYEVPFTRLFYKFEAPASSDSIFEEIKALEAEETILMKELFGHA